VIVLEKRSFVLGVGVGIIFSVIVVWIAYGVSDFSASGDEAVEKGDRTVDEETAVEYTSIDLFQAEEQTDSSIKKSYPPDNYEAENSENVTYNNAPEEKMTINDDISFDERREERNENNKKLEMDSKLKIEGSSEEISSIQNDDFVDVKITSGSNAKRVSHILQEKGVVESADEFENYLINNKKTKDIQTGDYKIPKDIDFEDLANIIINKPEG